MGTVAAIAAAASAARFAPFADHAHGAAQPRTDHFVEITGFKFKPATLAVRAGDTVTWVNRDIAPHTATAADGSWDTGKLARGEQKSLQIKPDMAADYVCRFHPVMKARITLVATES